MLSFDLRALESHAARVDAALLRDDPVWQEGDLRPSSAVQVTGRLSAAGAGRGGRFYFSGHIEGSAATSCRRCLEDVEVQVSEDLHLLLAEAGTDEADEPDVYVIDVREHNLDLRPAVREEWLLTVPPFALCQESCQGLCPVCGVNKNLASCNCTAAVDPRWSALITSHDAKR